MQPGLLTGLLFIHCKKRIVCLNVQHLGIHLSQRFSPAFSLSVSSQENVGKQLRTNNSPSLHHSRLRGGIIGVMRSVCAGVLVSQSPLKKPTTTPGPVTPAFWARNPCNEKWEENEKRKKKKGFLRPGGGEGGGVVGCCAGEDVESGRGGGVKQGNAVYLFNIPMNY